MENLSCLYHITYNPPGDSNCQFSALAHAFQTIGILRSGKSLWQEIVRYLGENPNNQDGFPFELFADMPWSQYLASMAQNGTYGDKITLQAVSNLFNMEIVIILTLGQKHENCYISIFHSFCLADIRTLCGRSRNPLRLFNGTES